MRREKVRATLAWTRGPIVQVAHTAKTGVIDS